MGQSDDTDKKAHVWAWGFAAFLVIAALGSAWYFSPQQPQEAGAPAPGPFQKIASAFTEKPENSKPADTVKAPEFIQSFRKIENALNTARRNTLSNTQGVQQRLQETQAAMNSLAQSLGQFQATDSEAPGRIRAQAREVVKGYAHIAQSAGKLRETYQKDMQAVAALDEGFTTLVAAVRQFRAQNEAVRQKIGEDFMPDYDNAEKIAEFLTQNLIPRLQERRETLQSGAEEYAGYLDALLRASELNQKTFDLLADTLSIILSDPELHRWIPTVSGYLQQMKSNLQSICQRLQPPEAQAAAACAG